MDLGALIRDRRVLVTGASGGLGAHFARLVARYGGAVAVGARRRDKLDVLVDDLRILGAPSAAAIELDVTDERSVETALAAAERLIGPVDVVVNNAGITEQRAALDMAAETFDRIIATNLRGVWLMSVAA